MSNRIIKCLVIVIVIFCVALTMPDNVLASQNDFRINNGELWGYEGNAEYLVVPDGVKIIQRQAFMLDRNVKTLVLPDSVIRIENDFLNQSRVETLYIGAGLQFLSKDAFLQAYYLDNIYVDPSNPVFSTEDGVLFNNATKSLVWCTPRKDPFDYTVPEGILRIEDRAFGQLVNAARGLRNITLPNSLLYLGSAFSGCDNLNSFELPKNLLTMSYLIDQKGPKRDLNIPASLIDLDNILVGYGPINVDSLNKHYKSVDGVLFNKEGTVLIKYPSWSNKTSYKIPEGVKTISTGAFVNTDLTEVIFPEGLEVIEAGAFYKVPLKSLNFPDSLRFIEDCAFANGGGYFGSEVVGTGLGLNVTSVTLPKNLLSIGPVAFNGTAVKEVIALNPETILSGSVDHPYGLSRNSITLYGYSGGLLERCAKEDRLHFVSLGHKDEKDSETEITGPGTDNNNPTFPQKSVNKATVSNNTLIIPYGTGIVSISMFNHIDNKTDVKSISIPDTVRYIEGRSFDRFQNLETITIPKNVVYIGTNAFDILRKVKNIKILNPNIYLEDEFISRIGEDLKKYGWKEADIPKYTLEGYSRSSTQAFANAYMCNFINLGTKPYPATSTSTNIIINGEKEVSVEGYNIDGYNYFKIRDLAMVLSSTNKAFDVSWDSDISAIKIISNKKYTVVGGELEPGDGTNKNALPTASPIIFDGLKINITSYTINAYNYFKLRDISEILDTDVGWNSDLNAIEIITN